MSHGVKWPEAEKSRGGRRTLVTMYLVVDCETNGLIRDWRAPITDLDNWPRAVQVAWTGYDPEQREILSAVHLVRPDRFEIPPDAQRVHGITTERARAEGRPVGEVLAELASAMARATAIIAHNASFDGSVIAAEYLRLGLEPPFVRDDMICTMKSSTDYCRLPGARGYKWPSLEELHRVLFNETLSGAHDARSDVAACARCFFELRRRGVIRVA